MKNFSNFIISLLVIFLPAFGFAVDFNVRVVNSELEGLRAVYVELTKTDGSKDAFLTDFDGFARFGDIAAGAVSMKLNYSGVRLETGNIQISTAVSDFAYQLVMETGEIPTDAEYTNALNQVLDPASSIPIPNFMSILWSVIDKMDLPSASPTPSPGNYAQFVNQVVPPTMSAGQNYNVSVTMKNTGSNPWTGSGGYKLGAENPRDNSTWVTSARVLLAASEIIQPGQSKTFLFPVHAPSTPGTYNFQWKMVKEGASWFGQQTPNLAIQVANPPVYYTAQFNIVGSGSVSGAGISCGVLFPPPGTCSVTMPAGAVVGYETTPGAGWKFASWSGACSGGSVTFNSNKTCTVTFTSLTAPTPTPAPTATPAPTTLKVTSLTANVAFPAPKNVPITWTAATSGGKPPFTYQFRTLFGGTWTNTNYTSSNTFTMTPTQTGTYQVQVRARNSGVTSSYNASLTSPSFSIVSAASGPQTVTINLSGSGSVSGTGYACGIQFPPPGTCSQTLPLGTVVQLNNTPASGWKLGTWGAACPSGKITFDANKTCDVTFTKLPIYSNDACTPYGGYVSMTECQTYHSDVGCSFSDVTGGGLMCWKPQW
jgi:hypothetical protein